MFDLINQIYVVRLKKTNLFDKHTYAKNW